MKIQTKRLTTFFVVLCGILFIYPSVAGSVFAENFLIDKIIEIEKPAKFDCESYIEQQALNYGLDPKLMLAIAKSESECKNKPNYLYDGEKGRYSAFGIFQITRTTYREYCNNNIADRFIPEKNIDCAMIIATTSGLHHWNESKHKWGK